jgi:hypothetical protein
MVDGLALFRLNVLLFHVVKIHKLLLIYFTGNNDPTDAIGFQTLVHTLFPKSSGDCSVKVFINSLKEINEKNMLCLKRRWSSFLHDDYQSFCRYVSCFFNRIK